MPRNSLRVLAHAKINWALNVLSRREDGYHILDMLVQRIALHDTLDIALENDLHLQVDGDPEGLDTENNLVMRAARALKTATGHPGGAHITLKKSIPSRAGLGGGSADAAAALQGLNALWNTGQSLKALQDFGVKLGADVPLCLCPGLMRVKGIGEHIQPLPQPPVYHLLLLKTENGLSTAEVFRRHDLRPDHAAANLELAGAALVEQNLAAIREHCKNQLEPTAIAMLRDIQAAIAALNQHGALFAQMTGSGSTVFGVFETAEAADAAHERLQPVWPVCIRTQTM